VEVINAWYGVENGNHHDGGGVVQARIRENIQRNNGRIVLDGRLFELFGFDPAVGVHKCAGIHVRHNGQDHHLRAQEYQPFEFPTGGNNGFQQFGGNIELISAWYGQEGGNHHDGGGVVQARIRENIQRNNGRIVLDGKLFELFGFDPVPGVHKCCAMHIRHNGQEHHLRAQEYQPFQFP
jgi:hypothetical protein